jgi:hypothetical protein
MKKLFLMVAVSALFLGSLFADAKTYVIDLGDTSNGKVVKISKNQYGPNYQNENPPVFTNFFVKDMPNPGDTIEVHYKLTSNVDLPYLAMMVIDNSQAAKWWTPISDQQEKIKDIKAGTKLEGVLTYKVVATPVAAVSVQLMYDDKINSKITLEKAGVKTGRK